MAASGKRLVGSADRLSDLPDGLLHTIMSFLTARQAVQMCVLSRRWEGLWCSMPCLNIDLREFRTSGILSDSDSEDEDEVDPDCARFEDFVINLLMFHSAATLDMFKFHVVSARKIKFADQWLLRGIKRFPRVVDINSNCCCKLPRFGSSSSRLNRLHLSGITLDRTFNQQLHSGCPVLEDLELKFCVLQDAEIASCTLKNLTIEHCRIYHHNALTIKAPFLTCLQLVITAFSQNSPAVDVNEMPFLIKATICLKASIQIPPCKLLFSLINVKDLQLTGFQTLANLHVGSDTFPVFPNVRALLFDDCDLSDNFDILECFLNNAPGLEKLTLQRCKLPEASKGSKTGGILNRASLEHEDTLTFKCPSLKWTEIRYKYDDDVQKVFDLLLGVWRNLQKTNIVIKTTFL